MGYILVLDENWGFQVTQGNTQLRPSLVRRYRSIFEGYMLILNHHL